MNRVALSFISADKLRSACLRLQRAGFSGFETFTPHAVPGLGGNDDHGIGLPAIMVGAAAAGALAGFLLQAIGAHDFQTNSGGRPVFSWPSFIPITFELGVLTAVLTGLMAFLWRAGLPNYHHPAFQGDACRRAVTDRYIVLLRADDPALGADWSRAFIDGLGAASVEEVSP